uniref:PH domain-containing protein n=1 Tax=Globisporangium ultimum (strain ATCC 200006 / CBS 805.95 / DAOM BR144) TaxID=431595 RepID=K3WAT7_GLOUD
MSSMEGYLMKRGLKMPVMHDRYCVATWEVDQAQNKYVLLRSYKSHKNFLKHPTKPASAVTLKCFGDWDGYGNFHKYEHAFLFETRESKVFLCAAPSDDDKRKWIEFMTNAGPKQDEAPTTAATMANNANSIGRGSLELKQMMRPSLTLNKGLSSRFINEIASTNAPEKKENNRLLARDDDTHSHSMTDSEFSPEDAHSPTSSGCASPHPGLDRGGVFTFGSPIKPSLHNHTLGYVHGLAPTRLSFPDIVTALTRQQSVESQSSDDARSLQEDLAFAFEFAPFTVSVPEVADIDEV